MKTNPGNASSGGPSLLVKTGLLTCFLLVILEVAWDYLDLSGGYGAQELLFVAGIIVWVLTGAVLSADIARRRICTPGCILPLLAWTLLPLLHLALRGIAVFTAEIHRI